MPEGAIWEKCNKCSLFAPAILGRSPTLHPIAIILA
jgi:hypothetical protein